MSLTQRVYLKRKLKNLPPNPTWKVSEAVSLSILLCFCTLRFSNPSLIPSNLASLTVFIHLTLKAHISQSSILGLPLLLNNILNQWPMNKCSWLLASLFATEAQNQISKFLINISRTIQQKGARICWFWRLSVSTDANNIKVRNRF